MHSTGQTFTHAPFGRVSQQPARLADVRLGMPYVSESELDMFGLRKAHIGPPLRDKNAKDIVKFT